MNRTETLEEVRALWWAMPRTNEAEKRECDEFYRSRVFGKLRERLAETHAHRFSEEYDLLISPLGTAPEPLMITITLLKPRRVVFLCDPHTEQYIEVICDLTGLESQCIHKHYIEKHDALPIYEAVHAAVQEEARRLGRTPRVAIDMTGGTKLMGAGCAMAGVLIGADIYYVAGEFDNVYRRTVPGTERLIRFQDPYAEFGHIQADAALARFGRHDYAGAAMLFEEVAEKVARPRTYQAVAHLSRAYEAWDALRLHDAVEQMEKACGLLQRFRNDSPLMKELPGEVLQAQLAALRRLHAAMGASLSLALLQDSEVFSPLLFTVLENAARCEDRGSYEAASLLLYRSIEMMGQRRLALRGFDTATADYTVLGLQDPASSAAGINAVLNLKSPPFCDPLPNPVSLFHAHALLAWMGDPYCSTRPELNLTQLKGIISTRNTGLYAHGFRPTDRAAHIKFREFTYSCLERLAKAEGWDLERRQAECRFIRLPAKAGIYS